MSETLAQIHIRHRKELRKAETARADMAQKLEPFFGATVSLLRALAECDDLPEPVISAAGELRKAVAALGGVDVGPPP